MVEKVLHLSFRTSFIASPAVLLACLYRTTGSNRNLLKLHRAESAHLKPWDKGQLGLFARTPADSSQLSCKENKALRPWTEAEAAVPVKARLLWRLRRFCCNRQNKRSEPPKLIYSYLSEQVESEHLPQTSLENNAPHPALIKDSSAATRRTQLEEKI